MKKAVEAARESHVDVRPKTPFNWSSALKKAAEEHWKKLLVEVKLRDRLMAGKPINLDAAKAMLKARGLEDAIEAVQLSPEALANRIEEVQDEGMCEFHRREGKPGIWFPTNNIKAGLKENWSVLGLRVSNRGSRGALAEGVFVYGEESDPDWIFLGSEPSGVYTAVSHTIGPRGPVSAIKRHEYVESRAIRFTIAIAKAIQEKLPDEDMADTLIHYAEHGLGACRSQGFGRFDIVSVEEVAS